MVIIEKNATKLIPDPNKINLAFGKIFSVSRATKSYNQLKLLNLVTMATTKIVQGPIYTYQEGGKILVFVKLFRTT